LHNPSGLRGKIDPGGVKLGVSGRQMDFWNEQLGDFLGGIASRRMLLKAALERQSDANYRMVMFAADALPGEAAQDRIWDYDRFLFVTTSISGVDLAAMIDGQNGTLLGKPVTLPRVQTQVSARHYPSLGVSLGTPLQWPHRQFELYAPDHERPSASGFMIGQDAPAFRDFDTAALEYIYGFTKTSGMHALPGHLGMVRIADDRSWISRVRVGAASVVVTVAGHPEQARLEVSRPGAHHRRRVSRNGRRSYRFSFPDGVPPGLWIVLSQGSEWLDYRDLDRPAMIQDFDESLDPEDPELALTSLVSQGEGVRLEFKRDVPTGVEARKILKSVAAFANGQGGSILFGVAERGADREGEISGVKGAPNELTDHLIRLVRDGVAPSPDVDVSRITVTAGTVIALTVGPGRLKPYCVDPANPRYYVRRGASTFPARVDEVRELVAPAMPPPSRIPYPGV
jgi:hypothetical protein